MQILVVEDERRMADLLERTLSEEGHHVVLAREGREAFEIARSSSFDVILLDVMLPGMDGIAVARRLRECRNQTPVLMLTARGAPERRHRPPDVPRNRGCEARPGQPSRHPRR